MAAVEARRVARARAVPPDHDPCHGGGGRERESERKRVSQREREKGERERARAKGGTLQVHF